jgi:hypothetical protein
VQTVVGERSSDFIGTKAAQVDSEPIPVYGTPDGKPFDETAPAYGTPEQHDAPGERRPHARRHTIGERGRRALGRFRCLLDRRAHGRSPDWPAYPGLVAGDAYAVLGGTRLDDVLERNERVLSRVRRALEVEFGVHWWANTDTETLEPQWNEWAGPSLLQAARSATWRTTSGLTSIEDRDLAARIVEVALAHEDFTDQRLERQDDESVLTAHHVDRPETTLTLAIGFSEFEVAMISSGVLAAEHEAEFRLRAQRYPSGPAATEAATLNAE